MQPNNLPKRLLYITNDSNWDTDISILPNLASHYRLEVYCLSQKDPEVRKYKVKTLPDNALLHDCQFGRSKKNPIMIFASFIYGLRVLFASRKATTIWVMDNIVWYGYLFILFALANRVIVSIHNYVDHTDARRWEKKMKSYAIKKFKYFHFHSAAQEMAFQKDYPEKCSFYTKMPVKDFGLAEERIELFDNHNRTFLFFGSIREYKRPDLFIEASNKLKDKANFIIAGTGPHWGSVQHLIDADNPIKCFIRMIDNSEIPSLFSSVDFLVLPYDDSTQSGPLLTAYNYNLPAIASSLPYFKEMIDNGKTGFLFDSGDIYSLLRAIETAIHLSDEEYKDLCSCLKHKVDDYKKSSSFTTALQDFINQYNIC